MGKFDPGSPSDIAHPQASSSQPPEGQLPNRVLDAIVIFVRQLFVILVVLAVVFTDSAYANTFFKDFLGVWRVDQKNTYVDDEGSHTNATRLTMRVTRQKNGVIYFYSTGKIDGKTFVSKARLYRNGTYRGESSLGGATVSKGNGRWWMDKSGRLLTRFKQVEGVIRRINKNKFVSTQKGRGTTSVNTMTRLRQ